MLECFVCLSSVVLLDSLSVLFPQPFLKTIE